MFRVNGMQIMMTAGDTGLLAIVPREGGYIPNGEDRAIFTVRERPGRRALIEKIVTPEDDGTVLVVFATEDTEKLREREYGWDIRYALEAETDGEGRIISWRELITPMMVGTLVVQSAMGEV